jgi:hypothetical protein
MIVTLVFTDGWAELVIGPTVRVMMRAAECMVQRRSFVMGCACRS